VPVQYSIESFSLRGPDFSALRKLRSALLVEGRLAEREGRTDDAIRSYLDIVRLGPATARGGRFMELTFAETLEGMGSEELHRMGAMLAPRQCREIIKVLLPVANDWEPLDVILDRGRTFDENTLGWQRKLRRLVSPPRRLTASDSLFTYARRERTKRQLLICELALRAHRVECGNFPERLADLIPQYLSAVPEDPFSEKPPIYRRQSSGYALYSVGPDGKDDGGKPLDYKTYLGDVTWDEPRNQ
jgi:hypothetical protein